MRWNGRWVWRSTSAAPCWRLTMLATRFGESRVQRPCDKATRRASTQRRHNQRRHEMVSQTQSPLRVGQVLEISFPTFKPRITIHSERELTVEIVAGDNIGFSDTVEYEAVA